MNLRQSYDKTCDNRREDRRHIIILRPASGDDANPPCDKIDAGIRDLKGDRFRIREG